jgi:hypothetical protein
VVDKKQVRRSIKDLQRLKTWQLVVLLLLAGFIAATFLRLNNIGMVERRTAVLNADESGDQETLIQRLSALQRYVSSHMNTDLGRGVYLEESYNRDLEAWQSQQFGDSNPNGNIYQKAQEVCAPQFSGYSSAYLQCTTSELSKYPAATGPSDGTGKPTQETYIHSFASPVWSPDFAGWSLVVCAAIIAFIMIRLISLGILKLLLRRHYRNA